MCDILGSQLVYVVRSSDDKLYFQNNASSYEKYGVSKFSENWSGTSEAFD